MFEHVWDTGRATIVLGALKEFCVVIHCNRIGLKWVRCGGRSSIFRASCVRSLSGLWDRPGQRGLSYSPFATHLCPGWTLVCLRARRRVLVKLRYHLRSPFPLIVLDFCQYRWIIISNMALHEALRIVHVPNQTSGSCTRGIIK